MRSLLYMLCFLSGFSCLAQEPASVAAAPATLMDKPLPPVADLLEAVEKHEDADEKILLQYTYHRHVVQEDFDGKSKVKKTTILDFESIPIEGVRVSKLVARDGKPLPPDEAKKVDEDFDKAVEKAKKSKEKFAAKKEQAEASGKSNKDFLPASRIMQLGTFSNERRILFNGRPTIVLDYRGNRDVKSQNEFEKVVQDLVGTCWIDEQDKVIARAEGHFIGDFKVGFGLLADIHQGLSFFVEEQKINGEAWLPHSFDFNGKASVGWILMRVNGHIHTEDTDYRKYRASATIVGSNGVVDENGKLVDPPQSTPPGSEPSKTEPKQP